MMNEKKIGINSNSVIVAKPGIVLEVETDNWGILFNPETDFSFGINPVSVFIWKQMETGHRLQDLVKKVVENCTNVPDGVEEDVTQFIETLLEKELAIMEST